MSVILLSDSVGQRTSDEHKAFDLSAGRTLLPLGQTKKENEPPLKELPASTYLPASG